MVRVAGFLTSFWLVGGEVTGSCFRNPNHQASGTKHSGSRWSHHSPPGWGFLVPTEKFKDMFQIAMYIPLEKEMATHSSVLAWRIPGTGEPGGLPSMGSHRVGHDWSDSAAAGLCFIAKQFLLFSCLTMFPLFLHSHTSLISNWLWLLLQTQRFSKCKSFPQTSNGGHGGIFVPRTAL